MPNRSIPTSLKKLKGTYQPCRDKGEPAPGKPGEPVIPDGFDAEQKAAWDAFLAVIPPETLTAADGFALEGMVCAYCDLRQARRDLAQHGAFYETQTGYTRKHPAATMVSEADKRLLRWLQKFGLTPVDRDQVTRALAENPDSPWADLVP